MIMCEALTRPEMYADLNDYSPFLSFSHFSKRIYVHDASLPVEKPEAKKEMEGEGEATTNTINR